MTPEEKLALLRALFSDAIEEYKEIMHEIGDLGYLGQYMLSFINGPQYEDAILKLFEVLADE